LLSSEFPVVSLDAIAATGAISVQFDLVSAVGHSFPAELSRHTLEAINASFCQRHLMLAALSGTYNMIDPDQQARLVGAEGFDRLIAWAPGVGAHVVTVCTGSRDPESMWRKHPDNDTPEAWADLLVQIERAVQVAEEYGVTLGVEPEIGNTINSVHKARRLLDEVAAAENRDGWSQYFSTRSVAEYAESTRRSIRSARFRHCSGTRERS
jgi:sugar phosphate isomerase/epimerase